MHVYDHDVRFGDVSIGGLVHHTLIFDLLNHGIEELSMKLGNELRTIVAEQGVPYAPVDFRIYFERYPPYQETRKIEIHIRPVSIGERSFEVEYELRRQEDAVTLARVRQVHVTITTEGNVAPLPETVRTSLEEFLEPSSSFPDEALPDTSRPSLIGTRDFRNKVTFYSPYIEASQLGFFGDYFRFISNSLEGYLMNNGTSLGELTEKEQIPFLPAASAFEFQRPIRFEETIKISGEIASIDEREIVVNYVLQGNSAAKARIHGAHAYGCYDADGKRRAFSPGILQIVKNRLISR